MDPRIREDDTFSLPMTPLSPPQASPVLALSLVQAMEKATLLQQSNQLTAAAGVYREWLLIPRDPSQAGVAWFNLGVLLRQLGDLPGCMAAYQQAMALQPRLYQAAVNLGLAQEAVGQGAQALAVWQQALQPLEAQTLLLNHTGRLLEAAKQFPQAEQALFRSLASQADQPDVVQHYIGLRRKQCKWPAVPEWLTEALHPANPRLDCGPFMGLAELTDPAEQAVAVGRFVQRKVIPPQPRMAPVKPYGHSRLRVGYFSGDFKMHAVSILTAELFELHDRSRVEVLGLDFSIEDGSPMRQRVLKAFDRHVPLQGLSDEAAARAIREAEVDVLIDLTGMTSGARPGVLRHKPAPVQVVYLGYMATTALPEMDYVLVDKVLFPDELRPHFVEKPLYLPRCYQVNDRQRPVAATPTRADCGLPPDAFVFCCFNNAFKLSPEVLQVWARILKRVPGAVLWLLEDNVWASERVRTYMQSQGVEAQRIVFAPRKPPHEHVARNACADLFLDSPPCGAGVTASEAMRAGLPLLTLPGRTLVSRVAASVLHGAGLPDLVVDDWAAYEEKAVALASQPGAIAAVKSRMRPDCELFDTPGFVRDLEDVLMGLCERHEG